MTQPGAVPLLPLFGAALLDHVDGPITSAPRKLERAILRALRTWEPRIEVVTVKRAATCVTLTTLKKNS